MKKLVLFSLSLLTSIALLVNFSYGSAIKTNEETQEKIYYRSNKKRVVYRLNQEKNVYRSNVDFSPAHKLNMEIINCSPTVTFRSTNPNLKIINAAGKNIYDMKVVPINANNPNVLKLVPNLTEEANLLNKPYTPSFNSKSEELSEEFPFSHATYPLALWVPYEAEDKTRANEIVQSEDFFKVEALVDHQIYEQGFNFQSFLKKHLVIKKDDDNEILIYMTDKIYPRKS